MEINEQKRLFAADRGRTSSSPKKRIENSSDNVSNQGLVGSAKDAHSLKFQVEGPWDFWLMNSLQY